MVWDRTNPIPRCCGLTRGTRCRSAPSWAASPRCTKGEPASRMGLYTTPYYFNPFLTRGKPTPDHKQPTLEPALFSPSTKVGLHPQMLALDVHTNDGANVGNNPNSTLGPGKSRTYRWYAGILGTAADGNLAATPVEFGAVNLLPADPLMQAYQGLFGGLIREPAGSNWVGV